MRRYLRFALIASALCMLLAVLVWPNTGTAQAKAVLTYGLISTGTSKIPAYTTTGEDTEIMNQIYDALLQVDAKTWKIQPALATRYTVSPDGKTWTFTLRKGVKWQRGYGEFTCADVQFTWDFNRTPENHSFWLTQAKIVDGVECPNPYTAVIHLKTPFLGFIWNVVNIEPSTGWILSKAAWDKLGRAGYDKTPVGTGPYMLQSLTPNQDVILVRNPDYWGPKPAVDEIDFKVVADSQTAALGVKSGALDIFGAGGSLDPVTAAQYQHTPGINVIARQALFTDVLDINMTVKPFDNPKVREAMRDAIDYPGLVSSVMRGFGTPGYAGVVMPGMDGFDKAVNPQNIFQLAKAKQLLQEAGVPLPIHGFFTTYNDTKDINVAQFVAANLAQAGIDLQARPLERGTLVQVRIQPATPASILGEIFTPDPDFLFSLFITENAPPAGLNISRYSGIDALYASQHSALTRAARLKDIKQIQQQLTTDTPAIELYQQKDVWLVNPRVHNFIPTVLFNGDPLNLVTLGE